jgi:hypothetical protein
MSKFDREEILAKYAVTMSGVLGAGEIAGQQALMTVGPKAIKTLAPKVIPMLLKRIGTGAAAGAATGLLGGPAGAAIGAILGALGAAWTAYEIWDALTIKAIDALIAALEDLDTESENDPNLAQVAGENGAWMQNLKAFKKALQLGIPTTDPQAQFADADRRFAALKGYATYLEDINKLWYAPAPQGVKYRVKDWGMDPRQFEAALKDAIDEAQANIVEVSSRLNQAGAAALQDLQQKEGLDVSAISKEILSLFAQLESAYGSGRVELTAQERQVHDFAKSIAEGKFDAASVEKYHDYLNSFKTMLQEAVSVSQKATKISQTRVLSKRALKTPGGSFKMKGLPQQEKAKTQQAPAKDKVVEALQKSINYLNGAYRLGGTALTTDGRYGPKTAEALLFVSSKLEALDTAIRTQTGLTPEQRRDHAALKANHEALETLTGVLLNAVKSVKAGPSKPSAVGVPFDDNEMDPSDENIIAALKNKYILTEDGQHILAYKYLADKHFSDPQQMVNLVRSSQSRKAPVQWNMSVLKLNADRQS